MIVVIDIIGIILSFIGGAVLGYTIMEVTDNVACSKLGKLRFPALFCVIFYLCSLLLSQIIGVSCLGA